MTMTNPDKPITKQDLADFYGKILPYMGGMPEVLANKFAKGDLYDTDEKIIGSWLGKPLYQKTFTGLNVPLSNWTTLVNIPNVEMIVSGEAYYWGSSKNTTMITEFEPYSNGDVKALGALNNRTINVLTLRYIKTTDSANSFNFSSETDYSTDEHIVGTWIDGSYLYQKTIEKEFTLTDNLVLSDLVGIDNIKLLVSANVHTNYIYNNEKWSQKLNPRIDYIKNQTYPNGAIRFGVSSLDNGAPVKSMTLLYTKY